MSMNLKNSYLLIMIIGLKINAQESRLRFLFMGDLMQHERQMRSAYDSLTQKYDYQHCYQYINPIIKKADIAVANLELTLAGKPYKGYPRFSAPDEFAYYSKRAGINYMTTANNHANDWGKKGVIRTIKVLDSLGIKHLGTYNSQQEHQQQHPLMIEEKGIKVALLNYTYGTNGLKTQAPVVVNRINYKEMLKDLKKAKRSEADKIIVITHWGKEYQTHPDAYQRRIGAFLMNNGADIVIGGHPHYLQPMAYYDHGQYNGIPKERMVAWSLGNFVSGQYARRKDGGAMLQFDLVKRQDGTVKIQNQGYYLTWVWAKPIGNEMKRHIICPVSEFINSEKIKLLNTNNQTKIRIFYQDSKQLMKKNNLAVSAYEYNDRLKKWELKN